jgi:hypothetical protein
MALLVPFAPVAERASGSSEILAITHVNVVPMDAEHVLEDRTVLVTEGTISALGHARDVAVPKGAVQIDGRGRYLMPGLADLHVHLFSADDLLAYVAAGVTTVANMDGGPVHSSWRDQVRAGELVGPSIYTAGHTIDGVPPLNEMFLTAETAEAARAIVAEQKRAGYDMVKVYGTLRPEVYRALLQAGEDARIPVVGHINRQVGALAVLKSSQALAAHLEDLLFARFDRPPSDAELVEFADAIAASSMTVTPNLNTGPVSIAQIRDLDAVLSSSEARLLSPAACSQWMPANNRNDRGAGAERQVEMMEGVLATLRKLARLLSSRGVRLVAGSDAAAYGIPGLSLHQERQELVKAGFSPYEALLTATRNSGEFLAEKVAPSLPRLGTVAVGSVADLVLVSANPLQDVGNAARVEGVWLRGRWLSSTDLKARVRAASTRFDEVKRRLDEVDALLEAGDEARATTAGLGLGSDGSSWIAEWVLMTKARKLQGTKLPAAIAVARLDTRLYPQSFSAFHLLGDLLFRAGDREGALHAARQSLALAPHNSATTHLVQKIETVALPLQFEPTGTHEVEYRNGVSGEVNQATIEIDGPPPGPFTGKWKDAEGESSDLLSVHAGGDRLWVVAPTPFGPIEFRIVFDDGKLRGEWAAPFGRNGTLVGRKLRWRKGGAVRPLVHADDGDSAFLLDLSRRSGAAGRGGRPRGCGASRARPGRRPSLPRPDDRLEIAAGGRGPDDLPPAAGHLAARRSRSDLKTRPCGSHRRYSRRYHCGSLGRRPETALGMTGRALGVTAV